MKTLFGLKPVVPAMLLLALTGCAHLSSQDRGPVDVHRRHLDVHPENEDSHILEPGDGL